MAHRLTLDWDDQAVYEQNMERVRDRSVAENQTLGSFVGESGSESETRPYELYQSSSGEGYHYVEYDAVDDWRGQLRLRQEYNDDAKRLGMDALRYGVGNPFVAALWNVKSLNQRRITTVNPDVKPLFPEWRKRSHLVESVGISTPERVAEWDRTRIKYGGEINYIKLVKLLVGRIGPGHYESGAALGRDLANPDNGAEGVLKTDAPRKTVSKWVTGERDPANSTPEIRRALRRRARKHDLGHYENGEATEVEPPGEPFVGVTRRHYGESMVAPDFDRGEVNGYYGLYVRTGYFGPTYAPDGSRRLPPENKLGVIHNKIVENVREILSPGGYADEEDVKKRVKRGPINYERKPLEREEAADYQTRMRQVHGDGGYDLSESVLWTVTLVDEQDGLADPSLVWYATGVWDGRATQSVRRGARLLGEKKKQWWVT
jgi:hypothetical protein